MRPPPLPALPGECGGPGHTRCTREKQRDKNKMMLSPLCSSISAHMRAGAVQHGEVESCIMARPRRGYLSGRTPGLRCALPPPERQTRVGEKGHVFRCSTTGMAPLTPGCQILRCSRILASPQRRRPSTQPCHGPLSLRRCQTAGRPWSPEQRSPTSGSEHSGSTPRCAL